MDNAETHWESVWRDHAPDELSWFEADPAPSLRLVQRYTEHSEVSIIDVGGGASRLVDALLDAGYRVLSVLDVSPSVLSKARSRLGPRALIGRVWLQMDVRFTRFDRCFGVWHDRAVFHFMTDVVDRRAYVETMTTSVRPGGYAIIATFAEHGPTSCSGLPVARYSQSGLVEEVGGAFRPEASLEAMHTTPAGQQQPFLFGVFTRLDD